MIGRRARRSGRKIHDLPEDFVNRLAVSGPARASREPITLTKSEVLPRSRAGRIVVSSDDSPDDGPDDGAGPDTRASIQAG